MKLAQDIKVGKKEYKAGDECPKSEELRLLLHNRDYLVLDYENSIPIVSKEYERYFIPKIVKKVKLHTQEVLINKLNELGEDKFKELVIKEYGEENINKNKSAKEIINKLVEPYTRENLTIKLNKLKEKGFKAWAEKVFGENKIDRRKTGRAVIGEILQLQERDRQ